MTRILSLLALMRWPNLLILFLTQWFFYEYVLLPALAGSPYSLDRLHFALLALASLLIAAGGNIVNDIYDKYADSINKPGKKINLELFEEKTLIKIFYAFTGLALMIGVYFSVKSGNFKVTSVLILAAGVLWLYNIKLKASPLIGNITIALLCALTIVLVFLAEEAFFARELYTDAFGANVQRVLYLMGGYTLFAFTTTLLREFIKDLQDIAGDNEAGYKTAAVLMGNSFKYVIIVLALILLSGLVYIAWDLFEIAPKHAWYIILLLAVPNVILVALLFMADRPSHYRNSGLVVKGIMVSGIMTMPVFHFLNSM